MFHESCHIPSSIDFKSTVDFIGTFKGTVKKATAVTVRKPVSPHKVRNPKNKRKLEKLNGHAQPPGKKLKHDTSDEN